jgi:drug/metabolite transporter (DMT)-like permease
VPFLLFFTGLAEASAPAAAVIHKTLFIWVALLAIVLLRERIGAWQVGALVVLLAAQLMVQPPTGVSLGGGEALIALATGLWAVETIVAKRLLRSVPTLVAGSGRMAFGLVVLVGYLAVTGRLALVAELGIVQWVWVLGTGALLAVYVGTWYAALQRAPAVTVAAVLTLGAPVTAGLQLIASGSLPAAGSIAGYLMIVLAGGALAAGLLWVRDREPRTAPAG